MSEASGAGVLYTEHVALAAMTPIASLWSYETPSHGRRSGSVTLSADGGREYWLDRWDPLLNTILPSTHVSLIINYGDRWASGRSLPTSALLNRVAVVGPVTQPRILRVGRSVHAIGAVLSPALTPNVFTVPALELVDRILPLQELWARDDVERLFASLSGLDVRRAVSALRNELATRIARPSRLETVGRTAPGLITIHAGRVSIAEMAKSYGHGRQQFAHRFRTAAGMPPKLFARITRFQALVHALLSTDVTRWASVAPSKGFYDQGHMINEFRTFAGSPPTVFFRPHGGSIDPTSIRLRGRPSEWVVPASRDLRHSHPPGP